MLDIVQTIRSKSNILIKLLPLLSFVIPSLVLYFLDPDSFEMTWKGRTYQLFFLWLFSLETILGWEEFQIEKRTLKSIRTVTFIITLLLPTIYVVAANYFGLNTMIMDLARQCNVPLVDWMPLSIEYLVFAVLFASIILLAYGINGLRDLSISVFFLAIIGVIYMIDTLYPYGKFTPFQFLVPTTTVLAANVLNLMGYETSMSFISNHPTYGSMPYLEVKDSLGESAEFGIAWPCSGIESLLIYTVTILLFLKKTAIPWMHKIVYFAIGAIVTYFINILRIATIFVIAIDYGVESAQVQLFHNYYGQLYSITWIIVYPLIIMGSRALWEKIRNWKAGPKDIYKLEVKKTAF